MRGVYGRLVHPRTDPSTEILRRRRGHVNSCGESARGRLLARRLRVCNSAEGCSLPRQRSPASARRSKANTKGSPADTPDCRARNARKQP